MKFYPHFTPLDYFITIKSSVIRWQYSVIICYSFLPDVIPISLIEIYSNEAFPPDCFIFLFFEFIQLKIFFLTFFLSKWIRSDILRFKSSLYYYSDSYQMPSLWGFSVRRTWNCNCWLWCDLPHNFCYFPIVLFLSPQHYPIWQFVASIFPLE